ncbi:MAG: endonuclease/exonuclease/phosphatase family protein [Clostridia bacterium]|nr:endonuclease/exonuclease/phosphatase family protein [Clostridia bacterium]
MRIMSFNTQHCLNFLEGRVDYDIMAKAITDIGADIVGLNEMFDQGDGAVFGAQTEILSRMTGLEHHYFAKAIIDKAGPYGNGLLSRYPLKSAEAVIIPDPNPKRYPGGYYETRCILKAELENGLTVLVTHFGLCIDEQENAVKELLKHIRDEKCILMGDFNLPPDSELLKPIREKMRDTADVFTEEKLSWPSDKPRMKIDYIFISPDIELVTADIPSIVASDHRPHIAEINA